MKLTWEEDLQLRQIRHWHSRMVVNKELALKNRHELVDTDETVAVFQHTFDDYKFLLALIDRAEFKPPK